MPVSIADSVAALQWRYAVKKFDPSRTIPADTWKALESALHLSPSSYGLQPWKFVIVRDPALRQTLKAASWNQSQITDASHLVVFCSRVNLTADDVQRLIDRVAEVRGVPASALDGYKNMMLGSVTRNTPEANGEWATRQAYIALGQFLATAAHLGVDACPMEGFEPAKYDELLGLTAQGYAARVLATAGYRAADDPYAQNAKVRFPVEQVIEYR
jgi:nitroreductase